MIVCAGQALIDCIISGGEAGDVAENISLNPGGEAFNEASVLAALGERVYLSSAIGSDHAGMILQNEAQNSGITVLNQNYSGRTPVSLLDVDSTGNRKSRVSRVHELKGYIPALPGAVEGERIDFVTMASLFRPPFLDPGVCFDFASAAKSMGAMLLADTKLPKGNDPKLSEYADVLGILDYITPNETEAEHYTGYSEPERAAEVFHSYGVKNVIIKLSDKGCYVSPEKETAFYIPAFKVKVVDGIGAGDTFAAGFMHSLVKGKNLQESAFYASACAAVSVTGTGGASVIKSEKQIEEFLTSENCVQFMSK
ncbi:MAG: carbohydrate kinase family protein [Eubacteriales bacterium]|nr:carbohydrate kinase family protein [Eubacteriales bacterium]